MEQNIKQILLLITLCNDRKTVQHYLQKLSSFLTRENTQEITSLTFNNYLSLSSFLSSKIQNLIQNLNKIPIESNITDIPKQTFIDGFLLLYCSSFTDRINYLFQFLDFDHDNYIHISDVKLVASHFHYLTNKTPLNELYTQIELFFNFSRKSPTRMSYDNYISIINNNFSDISLLFLFYFFNYKPFQECEIVEYNNIYYGNGKELSKQNNKITNYNSNDEMQFAEPSAFLYSYLAKNFNCDLKYDINEERKDYDKNNYLENNIVIVVDDFDDSYEEDLKELEMIERDITKTKNIFSNKDFFDIIPLKCKFNIIKERDNKQKYFEGLNSPNLASSSKKVLKLGVMSKFYLGSAQTIKSSNHSKRAKLSMPRLTHSEKKISKSPKIEIKKWDDFTSISRFEGSGFDMLKESYLLSSPINLIIKKDELYDECLVSYDNTYCHKCKISIVGQILFITLTDIEEAENIKKEDIVHMIPLKQLFSFKHRNDTNKDLIKKSKLKHNEHFEGTEIYSLEFISEINHLFTFKLSFYSKIDAEKCVELIHRKTLFRQFKKDYKSLELIGRGGFSKIKKCLNNITKEIHAVKIINKFLTSTTKPLTNINDFECYNVIMNELDINKILHEIASNNQHVVNVYDIYQTFNKIYIVMDYYEKGSLEDLIQGGTFFTIENKYKISSQIISAICFLHKNNIMHRDIKAANILLDENNNICLCDFGFSCILGEKDKKNESYGTVIYAPPEIYLEKSYDKSYDIWSMGIVLYYLYYGKFPFDINKGNDDIVQSILHSQFEFSTRNDRSARSIGEREMNQALLKVIQMCLIREPTLRKKGEKIWEVLKEKK